MLVQSRHFRMMSRPRRDKTRACYARGGWFILSRSQRAAHH